MHHHSKLRLSGSVALLAVWLAFVSVSACGNVVVDADLVGGACAAACQEVNPKGVELFRIVGAQCACHGCSDACGISVCDETQTPSDACLPCAQAALLGDPCQLEGLFQTGCLGHPECKALVDCFTACPNK